MVRPGTESSSTNAHTHYPCPATTNIHHCQPTHCYHQPQPPTKAKWRKNSIHFYYFYNPSLLSLHNLELKFHIHCNNVQSIFFIDARTSRKPKKRERSEEDKEMEIKYYFFVEPFFKIKRNVTEICTWNILIVYDKHNKNTSFILSRTITFSFGCIKMLDMSL